MNSDQTSDKRRFIRCRVQNNLFAHIEGKYFDEPATILDLNQNGIALLAVRERRDMTGKSIVLHLISDQDRAILRSLSARVVYSRLEDQHATELDETSKRYGLQFVNLSSLEELLLDNITKNYARPK